MSNRFALPALVLAGAWSAASAQGSFDFADVPGVGGMPSVEINLNAAMLGLVSAAAGASGDPQAAELLGGIQGVSVRVYEQIEDAAAVAGFIDETAGVLERDGWQRAVFVQEEAGGRVHMYLKLDAEEAVEGMTMMIMDGTEAVFINLAGTIDPVTLGAVTRSMGLGGFLDAFGTEVLNLPGAREGGASPATGPGAE